MKMSVPLIAALGAIMFMGCSNPVPPETASVITLSSIPGITSPVFGATPVTSIGTTTQYSGTISWSGAPVTFAASTVYTATITLTAKAGHTLTGVPADFFKVPGATSALYAVNSGVVTAVFPATGGADSVSSNIGTLKYVPAGRFQRDATAANISVITQPYRMSQYEITRAQFKAILSVDPADTKYSSGENDPAQGFNWYHVITFCNKLSLAEGLTPVYAVTGVNFDTLTYGAVPTAKDTDWDSVTATWTNSGYRLPTEMEWMWAAMGAPGDGQGGNTNTTGYAKIFAGSSGSNAIGDFAVFGYYGGDAGRTTTERSNPVGSKASGANELGLYDMSGNLLEWCWDWYATAYPSGILTDYRGAAPSLYRVRRGGGWNTDLVNCAVAFRYRTNPSYGEYYIGFRVVRP